MALLFELCDSWIEHYWVGRSADAEDIREFAASYPNGKDDDGCLMQRANGILAKSPYCDLLIYSTTVTRVRTWRATMNWRRRSDPRDKPMNQYEAFAWNDACSIAIMLSEMYDLAHARDVFVSAEEEVIREFETSNASLLTEFIEKAESRRGAFFKRIAKDSNELSSIMFLVLAILGLLRVRDVIEIRDWYRRAVNPGSGYRVTSASIYEFSRAVARTFNYTWPSNVFDALELNDGRDASDDDEECDEIEIESSQKEVTDNTAPEASSPKEIAEFGIFVFVNESTHFGVDKDGRVVEKHSETHEAELWCLSVVNPTSDRVSGRFFAGRPSDGKVTEYIRLVLGLSPPLPDLQVVALVPRSIAQSRPEFDLHLHGVINRVRFAKAGIGRTLQAHWLDNGLADLNSELSLFDEPAPTLSEIETWAGDIEGLWSFGPADPKSSPFARRATLAEQALFVLRARGWQIRQMESAVRKFLGEDRIEAIEESKKRLKRLQRLNDEGRISESGMALLKIVMSAFSWRGGSSQARDSLLEIGEYAIKGSIQYAFEKPFPLYELACLVPDLTVASDVIERAAFAQMLRGIPWSWFPREHLYAVHSSKFTPDLRTNGLFIGLWVVLDHKMIEGLGSLSAVPRHNRIGERLTNLCEIRDVVIRVDAKLHAEKMFKSPTYYWLGASGRWGISMHKLRDAAVSSDGPTDKKCWFYSEATPESKRALLTVTMPNGFPIAQLIKSLSKIPALLAREINEALASSGYEAVTVVAHDNLEAFDAPFVQYDERLRLLLHAETRAERN